MYDARRFTDAGFIHHELFFMDGSTPNDQILQRFIDVCETAKGAIAVHCKGFALIYCYICCSYGRTFMLSVMMTHAAAKSSSHTICDKSTGT